MELSARFCEFFVGVNDIWHEYYNKNGVEAERFEKVYDIIIQDTMARFPNIKIFLIAPFISYGSIPDNFGEEFKRDVIERAKLVEKIAQKYNLYCVFTNITA